MPSTITLDLPVQLDVVEARWMIFASLFGKGTVSSGKAAEYLGVSREEFLSRVGTYGISVFSDDDDDLEKALDIQL